jgi:Co/Zn/Cd efflux system component
VGWAWLDPATGLVGAVLVALWAKNLIVQSGRVLLDREMDHPVVAEIRDVIAALPETGNTQITDLHVWRVGNGAYACAISLLTHDAALTPLQIREALGIHEEISTSRWKSTAATSVELAPPHRSDAVITISPVRAGRARSG